MPLDLRSERPCSVFAFVGDEFDRNHDLGLHLRDKAAGLQCYILAPPFLRAHVAHIADHHRSARAELQRYLVRRARLDHKPDSALLESLFHVPKTLQHERIVPKIRLWVVSRQPEQHEKPLADFVSPLHCVLQGVVIFSSLSFLHPVQDVVAIFNVLLVQLTDTLLLDLLHRHSPSGVLSSPCWERTIAARTTLS